MGCGGIIWLLHWLNSIVFTNLYLQLTDVAIKDLRTENQREVTIRTCKVVFLRVEQSNNEKLPYVHGKVVLLHVEQSKNKKLPHVHGEMVFLCLENKKKPKSR